jgi:hypothetical protein
MNSIVSQTALIHTVRIPVDSTLQFNDSKTVDDCSIYCDRNWQSILQTTPNTCSNSNFTHIITDIPYFENRTYSPSLIADIECFFRSIMGLIKIKQPTEIRRFLLSYPDLTSFLPEICYATIIEFAANAQISLEIYSDYEIDDRSLNLYIRQHKYDDDILDRIDKLLLPFEHILSNSNGWVNITTDFNSPK